LKRAVAGKRQYFHSGIALGQPIAFSFDAAWE